MSDSTVAKAYAQALMELSEKAGVNIADEMTSFTEFINESNALENLLFLDVFTIEEKEEVLKELFARTQYSDIFKNFVFFMLSEKRIGMFPMVFKEIIVRDDHKKGFIRGTIEGSDDEIPAAFMEKIKSYLSQQLKIEPQLKYEKTDKVSAGYRVTVEDLQLDASLENQLDKLKNSIFNL
jgi:F-type H+-transporting ATPase subunit delta